MKSRNLCGVLALVCGIGVGLGAEQQNAQSKSKTKVPLMSVVGCASKVADGAWMLINASNGTESDHPFSSVEEVEEAKKVPLGANRYKLLGTAEFVTKEELLKTAQRGEFTRPEVANATGQLQAGRKVVVKGALIVAPNEKRLNLVSVQQLSEACK